MLQQFLRILKGDVEPARVRKWCHRLLSIVLVATLAIPLPFIILKCQDAEWAWAPFLVGHIAVFGLSILLTILVLFSSYPRVYAVLQRPLVIMGLFIGPVLWIAFYELALHRQPVDMMVIFFSAACILALIASTSIKSENFAKLLTFTIIFFIGFSILQVPFGYGRSRLFLEFYTSDKNSIDVVFVGNSHIDWGIDDAVIDDVLGINSHVLASGNSNMAISYYYIKQVLETQSPELIVLDAFLLMKETELTSTMRAQGNLRGIVAVDAMIDLLPPEDYSHALLPILYYHSDWKLIDDTFVSEAIGDYAYRVYPWLTHGLQERLISRAEREYVRIVPFEEYRKDDTENIYPENIDYLDKIISLCQAHDIELWLVQMPNTWPVIDLAPIVQSRPISFYDYNTDQTFELSRVHFYNSGHLNTIGEIEASLHIAQLLAEPLGLTINEEMYNRYRSVLVEELAIEVAGEQITYTLNMADSNTSQVEFAWQATNYGTVLAQSPYSSQNTISFVMPESGPYTVTLHIRNRNHPEIHIKGVLNERYDPLLAAELEQVDSDGD